MAGVGGDKIVDPVELARREPSSRTRTPARKRSRTPEPEAQAPAGTSDCAVCVCPMPADARFCPSCGERVILDRRASPPSPRPKPDSLLSDAERAERMRQHNAAVASGQRDPGVRFGTPVPQGRPTVLIHIVIDGFTAFGVVWMRGQELEVEVDGPRWEEARRWILMDDFQQMAVYKKIYFRRGPWPGLHTYTAGANSFQMLKALGGDYDKAPALTGPAPDVLAQADMMEQRRGRSVPLPTFA